MKRNNTKNIKFIDFCAGIGAGRLGLEKNSMECIGFSEINANSEKTYRSFFGNDEVNYGDLMKIDSNNLPDFDLMIGGFPCQSFSVIGDRKGMEDDRGKVIFGLIKIMKEKNLKYFILENVKGLTNHDGGRTLKIILKELDSAGYIVHSKVLNSLHYGVPQMRERIYLVGIRKDLINVNKEFYWPENIEIRNIRDCLIEDSKAFEFNENSYGYDTFLKYLNNKYNRGITKLDPLLSQNYLILDTRQSDLRLYREKVPTLRTGRHGIFYVKDAKLRKLSGFESLLLQGFPKELAEKVKGKIPDILLLSQAGNAMTVNVIEAIAKSLLNYCQIGNGKNESLKIRTLWDMQKVQPIIHAS